MGSNPNYGIIADFIVLTPILLLIRAAFPRKETVEATFALLGAYLVYTAAPRFLPFFLLYWGCVYGMQWAMWAAAFKVKGAMSKALTTLVILLALAPMVAWKLQPDPFVEWFTATFARVVWAGAPSFGAYDILAPVVAPIGLSFITFRALDLLLKVRLELLKPISPLALAYYGFFGPVLAVGPVIEYEEVRLKDRLTRWPAASDIANGLFRIGIGVVKVMIVAYYLSYWSNALWRDGAAGLLSAWGALLVYGFYFYVNFSGYSDLAIGASRLHGIKLKENFNNPYTRTNPQAFWNSWHMSLTRWCQRYVFVPLGGMRRERQYFAVVMTIMTIAFWHGVSWNMLIFGLFHAILLVGHRYIDSRRPAAGRREEEPFWLRAPKAFGMFVAVSLSIPLFLVPIEDVPAFYAKLIPGLN